DGEDYQTYIDPRFLVKGLFHHGKSHKQSAYIVIAIMNETAAPVAIPPSVVTLIEKIIAIDVFSIVKYRSVLGRETLLSVAGNPPVVGPVIAQLTQEEPYGAIQTLATNVQVNNDTSHVNTDNVQQAKYREVALFVLTKNFGGVKISKNVVILNRQMYALKAWADRAREKCYLKLGPQYSSLKKRPINAGGQLGYKLLIDGFNNDFCDFYSTAEYAKEKARTVYFIDDREKFKARQMENQLKSFNVLTTLQAKVANQQLSRGQGGDANVALATKTAGKKLWNKVTGIYKLGTFLLRNAISLIESGLISDGTSERNEASPDDDNTITDINEARPESTMRLNRQKQQKSSHLTLPSPLSLRQQRSRLSSGIQSAQSSAPSAYIPIKIRFFTDRFRLIKEMMYKPDKDGRTLRHLSGNEWANVKRRENVWHTQRISTAAVQTKPIDPNIASLIAEKNKRKLDMEEKKNDPRKRMIMKNEQMFEKNKNTTPISYNKKPGKTYHGGGRGRPSILPDIKEMKLLLPREKKEIDYQFLLRSDDKICNKLIFEYELSSSLSLSDCALQSMIEVTDFCRKSWIKKVNLGIEFAINHSKRTFDIANQVH
ncbi:unnamed protein product, partial [Didymodactylos carnosus]